MILKTFQPRARLRELECTGRLVGDWDRVDPFYLPAYRDMVAAMEERGIDCQGRPPVWAWSGPVTLTDAFLLLDEDHDLRRGYVTITVDAPPELVLLSDYGAFNDALDARTPWVPGPLPTSVVLQAVIPYLDGAWVSGIESLPDRDFDAHDWSTPV